MTTIAATIKYTEDGERFVVRISKQDFETGEGLHEDIEAETLKEALKIIEEEFTPDV